MLARHGLDLSRKTLCGWRVWRIRRHLRERRGDRGRMLGARPAQVSRGRSTDSNRTYRMLAWIRQLYDIERDGKKLDADPHRALRQ